MRVRIRGDEATVGAVWPQLADRGAERAEDAVDLEIVASADGAELREASRDAVTNDRRAILVELGSIGGRAIDGVDGVIVPVEPAGPCYRCLERRVAAATGEEAGSPGIPDRSVRRIMGAVAGHRAVEWPDRPYGTPILEFPWTERPLLPVPGCPDCDDDGRWGPAAGAAGRPRGLEEAIEAAEAAIDERVGIVATIGEADSLPLPYYLATLAETAGFSDVSAPEQAAGVAADWNEALMKAVGEALERYAASTYRAAAFRTALPGELTDAIPPNRFVRPADADAIDGPIPWLPATSLRDQEHRWVPAELVVFPPPHRQVRPAITTGLALGNTQQEARVSGLAEVIERDAAMLAWYSSYEPMGVTVDDPRFDRLRRRAAVEDLAIETVLLTQDVDIPVIGAAVHRKEAFPRFAIAAAAGLDPVKTAIDALQEAIQNWMELDSMGEERARSDSPRITRYASDPGPARAFVDATSTLDARALVSGDDPPNDPLAALVERADAAGLHPLAVRTTPRDLERLGFAGTRVIVPTAQPLFTGSAYFGDRAEGMPRDLGFEPRLDRDPHPFP